MKITKSDIEKILWKACDSFRRKIDSSRYKDYILPMLFVKYLDHFREVTKMVTLGSGAKCKVKDYMLMRYACYLIAMNGDISKEEIAFA